MTAGTGQSLTMEILKIFLETTIAVEAKHFNKYSLSAWSVKNGLH